MQFNPERLVLLRVSTFIDCFCFLSALAILIMDHAYW